MLIPFIYSHLSSLFFFYLFSFFQGWIENDFSVKSSDWEIKLRFSVFGQGEKLYGDGFALWLTRDPYEAGEVFGRTSIFEGVGIFFDTYDNAVEKSTHKHPYISAVFSDGSRKYDHMDDSDVITRVGCHKLFRKHYNEKNPGDSIRPASSVAIVAYKDNELSLQIDVEGKGEFEHCFELPDIKLPGDLYLGFTAETGHLADNHDIISFDFFT